MSDSINVIYPSGGRGGINIWICTQSTYPDFNLSALQTVNQSYTVVSVLSRVGWLSLRAARAERIRVVPSVRAALMVRFGLCDTTDLLVTPTLKPPMPRWPPLLAYCGQHLAPAPITVAFTVASDPCTTRSRSPPDTPAAYQAAALARSHCAARHTSAPNPKSRPALLRPRCAHVHRRSTVTL